MIEPATLHFHNGNSKEVERAKIRESGWVGAFNGDNWKYYPPQELLRVESRRND